MTDTTTSLADAAAIVATAEQAALSDLLAKATAFRAELQAIVAGLTFPAGYTSQPKAIATSLLNALTYPIDRELPQLIASYTPPAPAAPDAAPTA